MLEFGPSQMTSFMFILSYDAGFFISQLSSKSTLPLVGLQQMQQCLVGSLIPLSHMSSFCTRSHPPITETFRFCLIVYLYNMFQPSTGSSSGTNELNYQNDFSQFQKLIKHLNKCFKWMVLLRGVLNLRPLSHESSALTIRPGVPNLWYTYHWWYAESQVVRGNF